MDKIDKIVLAEIGNNCRQPLTKIGKKINRSPQFVRYRLENLKQKEIKNIPILIDYYKHDCIEITALIKFEIIDPISEKILIDHLIKMTETYKLAYTNGNYDILCSFVLRSLGDLEDIKKSILEVANVKIDFNHNHSTSYYGFNYLSEKYSEKELTIQKTNISEDNSLIKKILTEIQKNPFISLLDVSQKLRTTYEKVKYALNKTNLLVGNTLLISEKEIKRSFIFIQIKDSKKLSTFCKLDKNVVEVNCLVGRYDAYITIEALENINSITKKIIFDIKDNITDFMILDSTQFYKYGWYGL